MSVFQATGKSYDSRGRRILHEPDSSSNQSGDLYVIGDEFTDNSVRLAIRDHNGINQAKVEDRQAGVWNSSPFEVGEDSMFLGTNISLSSLGTSLKLNRQDGQSSTIYLDIPLADEGSKDPRAIVAEPRINRFVAQPDFSTEVLSTDFSIFRITEFQGYVYTMYFKTGSVAAVDEVTIRIYAGTSVSDPLIYEKNYPANLFPANIEVVLEDDIDLGTFVGDQVFMTISSSVAFSMLGDPLEELWFAADFQGYEYTEVITVTKGTDKFLIDNLGYLMADNLGNAMLSTQRITD